MRMPSIPVPGTEGKKLELSVNNYSPLESSASTMFKIRKLHSNNPGFTSARKQREVSFSSRSLLRTYALLLLAPKNTVRAASPSPLRRMSRQHVLQVPAKDRGQTRPRSASPSCQSVSNCIINKVVEWFGDAGVEDLSECYSIVLREYTTSAKGSSPAAEETNSASGPQESAEEEIYLIYRGKDGERAMDAFVTTLSSLTLFLCGVCPPLHEEFLQDLFHHSLYGPVSLEDFPQMVTKWNKAGPGSQVVIDVDAQYEDGLTALHLACDCGQVGVVQELLQLGADSSVVDREGNTAYHLAVTSGNEKCLKVLLDLESELRGQYLVKLLSVQNHDGCTPLMLAANSNQVQVVLQLLSADADVNATNCETGDSALHIAARKGYHVLARLLSVFDASLDIRNKSNETPLDAAETSTEPGAVECSESLGALIEGTRSTEEVLVADYSLDGPVLLSLDGGGVRGLLELMLLHKLESLLMEMDPSFKSLLEYFDWIIGSSTGSFVALGMVYQNLRPRNIYPKYFEVIAAVLKYGRPIPDKGYNQVIKTIFPDTTVFTDVTTPKVAIATTLADRSPPELHIMCNYGEARQGQKGPSERKVWEAARAATAGPTYVEAFENKLIDGGIMANNPTLVGMTEIVQHFRAEGKPPKIGMVLSLSTGVIYGRTVDSINIKGCLSSLLQDLKSALGVMQVFTTRLIARDGPVVDQASAWCEMIGCPFFRLSAPIAEVDSFEGDIAIIVEMMFFGLIYIKHNEEKMRRIAQLLIKHRNQKVD